MAHRRSERCDTYRLMREAEALAENLNDQRRLGRVSSYMANYFLTTGDQERTIEYGKRALAIAESLGDFPVQLVTNLYLGQAHLLLGDFAQAIAILKRNIESLKGDRLRERFGMAGLPAVMSRTWLVWCLTELGEFSEGIACGEEAVRIAETADQPFSIIHVCLGVGHFYLLKGEIHRAISFLERGLEVCRSWNIPILLPQTVSHLGYVYALSGRLDEAIPLLQQGIEQSTSRGHLRGNSLHITWLSEACLLAGREADARASAQRALALARQAKERGHEAYALRLLGEIVAREDPLDIGKEEDHYRQALALAEALGMRPLIAHCHVGLGKLYRRSGNLQMANKHLNNGVAMMREMQMGFWLEKAEAELKELP